MFDRLFSVLLVGPGRVRKDFEVGWDVSFSSDADGLVELRPHFGLVVNVTAKCC